MKTIKLTQIKDRYVVEVEGRDLPYICGRKQLKYSLKHVFGFSSEEVLAILVTLNDDDEVINKTLTLEVA